MQSCNTVLGKQPNNQPKQRNVLIGCPTEKWKRKPFLWLSSRVWRLPRKIFWRREKTQNDSLGKRFPFGKIRQDILTHQIRKLFTSTQYIAYCIYRVSDTKPGNQHVSSNLRVSTVSWKRQVRSNASVWNLAISRNFMNWAPAAVLWSLFFLFLVCLQLN